MDCINRRIDVRSNIIEKKFSGPRKLSNEYNIQENPSRNPLLNCKIRRSKTRKSKIYNSHDPRETDRQQRRRTYRERTIHRCILGSNRRIFERKKEKKKEKKKD